MTLTYDDAKEYVSYVVDDALCGRRLGDDQHAVIREGGDDSLPSRERKGFKYPRCSWDGNGDSSRCS